MAKKTSYEFNSELKKYAKMNIPVMPKLLPMIQMMMGVLYGKEKSDETVTVEKLKITTKDGYAMRAIMYSPVEVSPDVPCLIFYHGGGFVYPCAPHQYVLARRLAAGLSAKVLLIDYRLAPKYRFPLAVEDAYDAYLWVLQQGKKLGINPEKLLVCGDSAGGNLATAVCLMARDRHQPQPRGQMLLYPFVDRDMESESMRQCTDTPLCNTPSLKVFLESYTSDAVEANPGYFVPLEADSLQGLPPAYIETAEFDCLRTGGLRYAKRLREAGVTVELHETKGTMHGYDIATESKLVKNLMNQRVEFLKRQVEFLKVKQ